MSDIVVNIPGDRNKYLPGNQALVTLYALQDNLRKSNASKELLRYTIDNERTERYLSIYPSTGDIMFTKEFLEKRQGKSSFLI